MRILVHIVHHKTGSTWLQKEIFEPGRMGFYPLDDQKNDYPEIEHNLFKKQKDALCHILEENYFLASNQRTQDITGLDFDRYHARQFSSESVSQRKLLENTR